MLADLSELVHPRFFSTLDSLELIAKSVVEGFLHGLHKSPYVGFSVEFASHREYLAGDDLRHLNWKLYGRHDKLYVKQYDAQTNLDCHLVLDVSRSMETCTTALSKLRYAAVLTAGLAHLALGQRDAVGLTLFADRVIEHLPARARPSQWEEILLRIDACTARPRADSADVLHAVAELLPRRGLVVLASDLFYDSEELLAGLDHLRFVGHDLIVFQILDPLERRLEITGPVRFEDLETGAELATHPADLREAYVAAVAAWTSDLARHCQARAIDLVPLVTDEPLDRALFEYLNRRSQNL